MLSVVMPRAVSAATTSRNSVFATALPARFAAPADRADVGGVRHVDLIGELHDGVRSVAETFAVALVHQQFVIVDGDDVADGTVLRLGGRADVRERVGDLLDDAGAHVDADDARVRGVGAAVLFERALHRAVQRSAVGADGEPLHALVGDPALRVAGDLDVASAGSAASRRICRAADTRGCACRWRARTGRRTARTRR